MTIGYCKHALAMSSALAGDWSAAKNTRAPLEVGAPIYPPAGGEGEHNKNSKIQLE